MYKFVLPILLVIPVFASAHVVVRPSEAGIGSYQTFNISVPTEKDIPTTGVRLVVPEGLESVRPNVKPGWNIEMVKSGEGEDALVSEIIWTGGTIPDGQRDDFFFSAKTPATESTLIWKAYQTYSDGTIVSWDSAEEEHEDGSEAEEEEETSGPYSTTQVINDLTGAEAQPAAVAPVETQPAPQDQGNPFWWECLVIISAILSGIAFILSVNNSIKRDTMHTSL